jgi:uncharacterized protein
MMETERRTNATAELRVEQDDAGITRVIGYGALFNSRSEDLGGFVEEIDPSAFNKTIQEADVRALWQHDATLVMGRTRAGTLEVAVDARGLRYSATLPDAQWARDAAESLRRGDVSQSSFGFIAVRDRWEDLEDGGLLRTLLEVKLRDVSPVTFPAYPETSAAVRSRIENQAAPGMDAHAAVAEATGDAVQARARMALRRRNLELMEQYFHNGGK